MKPKIAIVTQSYIGDLAECKLLCESIDLFVDNDIHHYIFVNDEDYEIFIKSSISERHIIKKKSEIMPKGMFRFPYRLFGHKYLISLFTIPVREWIVQQICKLGAFDAIDNGINVIINIDSETVFCRKFTLSNIYDESTGSYILFKEPFKEEPCHIEYCKVSKKLLNLNVPVSTLTSYCYMSHPVIFVKENIESLVKQISKKSLINNWKIKLCNTYRFSEYYLYGLFSDYIANLKNHYIISKHLFPMIDISKTDDEESLMMEITKKMSDKDILGVWLQKSQRNNPETKYLDFEKISMSIHSYWNLQK